MQTGRHADRQTGRQADMQTGRHADILVLNPVTSRGKTLLRRGGTRHDKNNEGKIKAAGNKNK